MAPATAKKATTRRTGTKPMKTYERISFRRDTPQQAPSEPRNRLQQQVAKADGEPQ